MTSHKRSLSGSSRDHCTAPSVPASACLLFSEEVGYTLSRGPSTLTTFDSISQRAPLFCSSERWIMEAEGDQQGAVINGETGNILSSQSKTLTTTSNLEGSPLCHLILQSFHFKAGLSQKPDAPFILLTRIYCFPGMSRASITLLLSESIYRKWEFPHCSREEDKMPSNC